MPCVWCLVPGSYQTTRLPDDQRPLTAPIHDRSIAENSINLILSRHLVAHLGVLPNVDLWRDDRIGAGGDWKQEITQAMDRASVAILLITVNFLNSGFIQGKEVPRLLETSCK